ncbi:MAG: hypothetical protein Q4D13_05620 [Erysipelotrichaceae bacterium]|nr:hypothetical protein [Erysipelotrichaceae bacterium]
MEKKPLTNEPTATELIRKYLMEAGLSEYDAINLMARHLEEEAEAYMEAMKIVEGYKK